MELLNFIGGAFVPAENKITFSKRSPFDDQVIAEVTASDAMDVVKAVQSAKKAAPAFRDFSLENRATLLQKMADYLELHADTVAYEEALHQGLPHHFVLENSVKVSIDILRRTVQSLSQQTPSDILLQPTGIVGIITSWNLSLRLVIERLAPTLAAGNVALIKVSELSPITGKILAEMLKAAQLPEGVVNIIQGHADVAQIIAGHPSVRAISAVGRSSTLESIAKAGLPLFKKLQLSGGVKNPLLILSETNLREYLPEILRSFVMGQGQLCWNTSRIFVVESLAPELLSLLKEYFASLQPLSDPRGSETWSPLISREAVTLIHNKIQSGISEHGKIYVGGAPEVSRTGFFYKPTVMLDLPNCSVLQQDELQGPLLLVTPVKYQHEALKWANTSYLAHSAVVWGPQEKAAKVASQLECAQVWMNSWMTGSQGAIFGHKQSSFGNFDMSWSGSFYSDVKKLAGTL
ncbi:MAG: aldehyde dehydrogenase family protein [Bdellovibrio sp.]|nr:aldehyde dehydrogenase family protein [Bdellovibrio sp.]